LAGGRRQYVVSRAIFVAESGGPICFILVCYVQPIPQNQGACHPRLIPQFPSAAFSRHRHPPVSAQTDVNSGTPVSISAQRRRPAGEPSVASVPWSTLFVTTPRHPRRAVARRSGAS